MRGVSILDIVRSSPVRAVTHPGYDVEGWDIAPHVVEAHIAQVERAKESKPISVAVNVMHGDEAMAILARGDVRDALQRIGAKVTLSIEF
jgi:hypothetical protein